MISTKKDFYLEKKDCADLLGLSMKEYNDSLKKIKVNKPIKENKKYSFDNSILKLFGASEKDLKKRKVISDWEKEKASIGEIWVTLIPKIIVDDKNDSVNFSIERRPCLIIDDGRGFLIEENSNYSGLKLTTRNTELKRVKRKEIKNWKELGLKKKSYVRIELPLKIESSQLESKITKISDEDLKMYLKELANFINVDILIKILES